MMPGMDTVTLYRPVGPAELKLIEASGWREFPPRLPEQPIFYPVLNQEYAVQIARDWKVKESGSGLIIRFAIAADTFAKYKVETVGGAIHKELWVPAEELPVFNQAIISKTEVVARSLNMNCGPMLQPAIYWLREIPNIRLAKMPRPRGGEWLEEQRASR